MMLRGRAVLLKGKISGKPGLALRPSKVRPSVRRWQRTAGDGPVGRGGRGGQMSFIDQLSAEFDARLGAAFKGRRKGGSGSRGTKRKAAGSSGVGGGPREPEVGGDGETLGESWRLRLIRDGYVPASKLTVESGADAAALLSFLQRSDREKMWAINTRADGTIINVHLVSVGGLTTSTVDSLGVFKAALLCRADAVYLAHNHPSGMVEHSGNDREITRLLAAVGVGLGIEVRGHAIVGNGRYRVLGPDGSVVDEGVVPEGPDGSITVDRVDVEQTAFGAGQKITNAEEAVKVARSLCEGGVRGVVMALDTRNRVVGTLPLAAGQKPTGGEVRRMAYLSNAIRCVACGFDDEVDLSPLIGMHESGKAIGLEVLDVIMVRGGVVLSAAQDTLTADSMRKSLGMGDMGRGRSGGKPTRQGNSPDTGRAGGPRPVSWRRKFETLVYWVRRTGTDNVRLADVRAFASEAEIEELTDLLRAEYRRNRDAESLVVAAAAKPRGAMRVVPRPGGGYHLVPDDGDADRGCVPATVEVDTDGGPGDEYEEANEGFVGRLHRLLDASYGESEG